MALEEAARQAAGNWRRFESFSWHRGWELDDADDWCIVYTHHRDSDLLDQSNADFIRRIMSRFTEGDDPDVVFESHGHWAVGHVNGISIRVNRDGEITEAFCRWHELAERLAAYPVLDEQDYSNREYEATLENIADTAWRLKRTYALPTGWEGAVFSWLWENDQRAVENRDDRGGCPSEAELEAAFRALGYADSSDTCP
jgi:hypothetical protein